VIVSLLWYRGIVLARNRASVESCYRAVVVSLSHLCVLCSPSSLTCCGFVLAC